MLLLTLFALGILLIDLFLPKQWKQVNAIIALIGLAFSAAAVVKLQYAYNAAAQQGIAFTSAGFMNSLLVDRFALYFFYLFLLGAAVAILMSVHYLEVEQENHGEFYALLLLSVVGMMCMAAGYDIVLIFIGLELMAISTYVLVGFLRRDKRSNEAALKYLLLGAFSSGIFAYGLSLFYGLTGSTNLKVIAQKLQENLAARPNDPVAIFALLATATGLLFKIAAVPFHVWTPDVYQGAPTPVTALMSACTKVAAFGGLLRVVYVAFERATWDIQPIFAVLAIITMLGGAILAVTQTDIKRLLAYSSIANAGYLMVGVIAFNQQGLQTSMFYLVAYGFTVIAAFAVVTLVRDEDGEATHLSRWAGLARRSPLLGGVFTFLLLAFAGIPLTSGFTSKFAVFDAAIQGGALPLVVIGVISSAILAFPYVRAIVLMFFSEPAVEGPVIVRPSAYTGLAVAIGAAATVVLGVIPQPLLNLANHAASQLFVR
jgi:NADH-quinone oxidoreductase subunit N